jgi:hypothetical protein
MLAIFDLHLSGSEFLFDTKTKKCFLYVCKNGSRSLDNLNKENPNRYVKYTGTCSDEFFVDNNIDEVVVFIREPIGRFKSALFTQNRIYNLPIKTAENMLNSDCLYYSGQFRIPIFDEHTIPQFWYLVRSIGDSNIKFDLRPLSEINLLDNIRHLNPSTDIDINLNQTALDKLDFFYTEDIVLYNKFLNSKVTLDQIINEVKLEKSFIESLRKYKRHLTNLMY